MAGGSRQRCEGKITHTVCVMKLVCILCVCVDMLMISPDGLLLGTKLYGIYSVITVKKSIIFTLEIPSLLVFLTSIRFVLDGGRLVQFFVSFL